MKKKIVSIFIVINLLLIVLIIYTNDMQMNKALEIKVPSLTKRKVTRLVSDNIFDSEKVLEIYLSKSQMKKILELVKNNNNWNNTNIDERLVNKIKDSTRNEIYYTIPEVKNMYWIFSKRLNGGNVTHNIKSIINDSYNSISLGILDIDTNTLYYYEYDR